MLATIDIVIVGVYALALFFLAQWVSRSSGTDKNASDYFLAGKSLPWWAIGASLIAANISAEQIIGMSGSGYAIGLAIASYEWMAAITLILVGKYLLPVFLRAEIYTMPQFLQQRYDHRVRLVMAFFWLGVYVLVNLTSVLWLGALAINTVAGVELNVALLLLGVFAAGYSLYGGLKAVALTDIIQVVLLVLGGLLISWILLNKVSDGAGVLAGFGLLMEQAPEKFDMILSEDSPHYMSLPGLSVLIGGMWVMNVSYWGFNQYIIQRTLAAKSLKEGQKGIAFAAFLKLIIPVIVVLPGIIAYVMNIDDSGMLTTTSVDPGFIGAAGNFANDNAAPWLIKNFIPVGVKGLILAALAAAIVSSLASMLNSTSTIFTMDIYKSHFNKNASDAKMVTVGRITVVVALIIAILIAPQLEGLGQVFIFIQEYTGVVSPGILAVFLMGLF